MAVVMERGEHPALLRLRGDIDFFTEDGFRENAERLLDDTDVTSLIVDLADVSMMDSSGLSLLVDIHRLCQSMALPMMLRDVPERVVHLLDMTGLDQIMSLE